MVVGAVSNGSVGIGGISGVGAIDGNGDAVKGDQNSLGKLGGTLSN